MENENNGNENTENYLQKGGKKINNARQVACYAKFICREVKLDYRRQTSRSGKKFQVWATRAVLWFADRKIAYRAIDTVSFSLVKEQPRIHFF